MRPPALRRGCSGKTYLHPLKLFLMDPKLHQMASLNRWRSEEVHRTGRAEAENRTSGPRANFRGSFKLAASTLARHVTLEGQHRGHAIQLHFPVTTEAFKLKASCGAKRMQLR